jgi:ABC-type amino acid transport substrate-binding protein
MTPTWSRARIFALALAAALAAGGAAAAPANADKLPGFVDGAPFLELDNGGGQLVEISLPGSLLKVFCGPLKKEEPELASVACNLDWIGAVIVGIENDVTRTQAARLFGETEKRLLGRGWERLALVRDKGNLVKVLILNRDQQVSGLVVMVMNDEQIVFTNVAGSIDLEKLGELGQEMDIPGLDEIGR